MKDYKIMNSQELFKRYMEGDSNISLRDIEKKENEEYFNFVLNKWSFEKEWLRPVVIFPVFVYLLLELDPMIFCCFAYVLAYLLIG